MKVSIYLPCRRGSERIKHKNTRIFSQQKSLFQIKIESLIKCSSIYEICVSTNDDEVINQAKFFKDPRIKIFERKEELCLSTTNTDELVYDMQSICSGEVYLWTHVTSPFMNYKLYEKLISKFLTLEVNDSLMTVTKHQSFFWYKNKPLNYDPTIIKWPNTQTLDAVLEINSGVFLISASNSRKFKNRVGKNPYLFETSFPNNIDIDWPADFAYARYLYDNYNINEKID